MASCPTAAVLITAFLVCSLGVSGGGLTSLPSLSKTGGASGAASGAFVVSIFCPALMASS